MSRETRIFGAMVFVLTCGLSGAPVLVDDATRGCQLVGVWADNKSQGFSGAGSVGGLYHYTSKHPPSRKTGRERAIWTPELTKSGNYEVEVSYRASSNRSGKVTYEVTSASGKKTIVVNQTQGKDLTWQKLGTFAFEAGQAGQVALVSDGGGSAVADAARFTPQGESPGRDPGGNLDNVLNPSSPTGSAVIRLDKSHPGTRTHTFDKATTASVTAFLATYGAAKLGAKVTQADGTDRELLAWERRDDVDNSPLLAEGKPVAGSIVEAKPGDFSAAPITLEFQLQAGDVLTLSLDGKFGKAEPYIELGARGGR